MSSSVASKATGDPTLTTRELLGLLSARLIHSMSNHLVVITGNICAAARMQEDPAQAGAALNSALKAANDAGVLLEKFAACRRSFRDELGRTSLEALVGFVHQWASDKEGWTFELDMKSPRAELFSPLSHQLLAFVLDAIVLESNAADGAVRFSKHRNAGKRFLHPTVVGPEGQWAEISITYRGEAALDWGAIRTQMSSPRLTAAYEVLAQIHAKPESRTVSCGVQFVTLHLPLTP